ARRIDRQRRDLVLDAQCLVDRERLGRELGRRAGPQLFLQLLERRSEHPEILAALGPPPQALDLLGDASVLAIELAAALRLPAQLLFDLVDRRGGSLELRGISRPLGRARQLALLVGPPALVLDLVERPRIAGRELAGARLGGGELALRGLDRLRAA